MPSCCCCFSNNIRHLVLLAASFSIAILYSNLVLFNFTAILHKDLHPALRPVEGLDSLHEYSTWHDRRKRAYNLTSTANAEEKTIYTEEEGYPILPSTRSIPTTTTAKTTTAKSTTPRLVFFTNSPTVKQTGTTRVIRQTGTTPQPIQMTVFPNTTREKKTTPVTTKLATTTMIITTMTVATTTTSTTTEEPTTRNVILEEVRKAIEKYEKQDKDLEKGDKNGPEKVEDETRKPMRDVAGKTEETRLNLVLMANPLPRMLIYTAPGLGCLLGTLPSMFLVKAAGIRVVLPLALVLSGILLIILPFIISNRYLIFTVRLLLGLTFSVAFPVAGALAAVWGTLTEQLSFISTILMFFVISPICSWPFTMLLSSNEVDLFWIYVTHAVIAFVMALIFFIFYRDHPQDHPWVNGIELNRVVAGKVRDLKTNRASSAPCSTLLRSLSAWSIWLAAFACFCVFGLFVTYLPSFLTCQQVFMVDHLGAYSVLPYVSVPLFFVIGGLINNLSCSSTTKHVRICNSIAFAAEALMLFIFPIVFHNGNLPVLVAVLAPLGLIVSGFLRSATLVGRGFAQHIIACFGICLGVAFIVTPLMIDFIVNENSLKEWSITFFITAGILIPPLFLFAFFGRGRSAGWAESTWDPLVRTKMLTTDPIDLSADECGLYEMKLIPKKERS